ncbi:MAG: hypothetical protein QNI91_07020 [Arenicellales bacterium]|nr:hypothetical protein [Arenicellales bacterium]
MNIAKGKKMLSEQGLNMLAILGADMLPTDFNTVVQKADIRLQDYTSLILIGHSGNMMWRRLHEQADKGRDPVDEFSVFYAKLFVEKYLDGCAYVVLYPGELPIPLQQLGELAGWQHRSPLGLGINKVSGPWFGYRAALLVGIKLPAMVDLPGESPCEQCADKPCITTCPANALSASRLPNVSACVDYRLQKRSPCAQQCIARLACPVGSEFRYCDEQINYFYGRSLDSIKAHLAE